LKLNIITIYPKFKIIKLKWFYEKNK
jgi:hypothetical protein